MVDHHELTVEDLKPSEYNPRKITDKAAHGLTKAMCDFGDLSGITWNKRTGNLVCGHQRVDQLKKRGAQMVKGALEIKEGKRLERFPVRVVDWDEGKEKAANVTANNPSIGGEFTEGIADLLPEIRCSIGDEAFGELMLDDLAKSLGDLAAPPVEVVEDEVPEQPKDPVTKLGDVWTLGDHRLVCGDARAVIPGVDAEIHNVTTDPPYGVEYVGKTKAALTIQNDGADGLQDLIRGVLTPLAAKTAPGASWFVAAPAGPQFLDFAVVLSELGVWRQTLVWVKDSMVLGRSDYHYRHEAIFYGWTPGGAHRPPPGRKHTTVWEFDRPKASREHPTMKPVALFSKAIADTTRAGDACFDPFLGSGTTLIAAEQLGRKCHGVEISPAYCDVIIERWENLTGGKATRA